MVAFVMGTFGVGRPSQQIARAWLAWRLHNDRPPVRAILTPSTALPADRVKIAAVQWNAEPVQTPQEWSIRIRQLFGQAAQSHCHLIVFPKYLPLSLLGCIMPANAAVSTFTDATIQTLLRSLAPSVFRHWHRWMAHLSRQYGMMCVAGTGLTVDGGRLINVAVAFNPDGTTALWQPQWHLRSDEVRWGVAPGSAQPPDVAAPWQLGVVVCHDANYFESFRMVEAGGARIVAVPTADPQARYVEGKARRGCFSRVQDVPMVGVVAASTGRLFGLRLTGKAGIYLPSDLTPDRTGVMAESPYPVGEGIVTAVVSIQELTDFRKRRRAETAALPAEFLDALYQFKGDR